MNISSAHVAECVLLISGHHPMIKELACLLMHLRKLVSVIPISKKENTIIHMMKGLMYSNEINNSLACNNFFFMCVNACQPIINYCYCILQYSVRAFSPASFCSQNNPTIIIATTDLLVIIFW